MFLFVHFPASVRAVLETEATTCTFFLINFHHAVHDSRRSEHRFQIFEGGSLWCFFCVSHCLSSSFISCRIEAHVAHLPFGSMISVFKRTLRVENPLFLDLVPCFLPVPSIGGQAHLSE